MEACARWIYSSIEVRNRLGNIYTCEPIYIKFYSLDEAILARVRAIAFTDSVHSAYPLPYTNVKKDPTASYLKEVNS